MDPVFALFDLAMNSFGYAVMAMFAVLVVADVVGRPFG